MTRLIIILFVFVLVGCNHSPQSNNKPVIKSKSTQTDNELFNSESTINTPSIFNEVKKRFVFSKSDSIPGISYVKKLSFDNTRFIYTDWLDEKHILIMSDGYRTPNELIIFNTSSREYKKIVLTGIFEKYGSISSSNIYGLSTKKDYLLFAYDDSHSCCYTLLAYDLKSGKAYDIESFINDKDIVYKKTYQILATDGRKYSFLPDILNMYGKFSFTADNGFKIELPMHYITKKESYEKKYLTTIKFPSLQDMLNNINRNLEIPIVESEEVTEKEAEKRFYFGNYYYQLPLRLEKGKLYNVPRSNVGASFGLESINNDDSEPYMFAPFHYYLDPESLTPKFESDGLGYSSASNEKQKRFTGLLIVDKETYELKKALIHGIGVQHTFKREDKFLLTSIYSDSKDSYLILWDLDIFKPVARLNMDRRSNYIEELFFDKNNNQIIAVHSNPAKIYVWDYNVKKRSF